MKVDSKSMRLTYGYKPDGIIDIDIADPVECTDAGIKLSFYSGFSHFVILAHKDDLHRQTLVSYPNAAYMDEWIARHPEAEIVMRWPALALQHCPDLQPDCGVTLAAEGGRDAR